MVGAADISFFLGMYCTNSISTMSIVNFYNIYVLFFSYDSKGGRYPSNVDIQRYFQSFTIILF